MAVARRMGRDDDLSGATYDALSNLIDVVREQEAGLLTLSGDLFDHADQENPVPRRRLARALEEVPETAVAVVRGNHDHHKRGAPRPRYPGNVFEFEGNNRSWDLGWVRVHGVSFDRQHVRESLLPFYPPASSDHLDIGLLHANVGGRPGHDDYAPCTLERLVEHGYDAWLLGHIHKREVLSQDPLVVYPGNLQGRHANESGPRSVEVVDVDAGGSFSTRPVPVHSLLWLQEEVDVSSAGDVEEVMDAAFSSCEALLGRLQRERGAVLRLRLVGATQAHSAVVQLVDRGEKPLAVTLREELNERFADRDPFLLTDRVEVDTRLPVDLEALADSKDVLGVLVRVAGEEATREEALQVLAQGPVTSEEAEVLLERYWEPALQDAVARMLRGRDPGGSR